MIKAFVSLMIGARSNNRSCNLPWIKTKILVAGLLAPIAICLSILLIPHSAYSGGNSAGGGNPILASDEDLNRATWAGHNKLETAFWHLNNDPREIGKIFKSERVREIISFLLSKGMPDLMRKDYMNAIAIASKGLGVTEFLNLPQQYFLLNPITKLSGGWCKHNGSFSAGSAEIGNTKKRMCLSRPALKKLPVADLVNEVAVLMAHEYAHQLGIKSESDAKILQGALTKYFKHKDFLHEVTRTIGDAASRLMRSYKFMEEGNKEGACWALGTASGDLFKMFNFTRITFDKLKEEVLSAEFYSKWEKVNGDAVTLAQFCGVPFEGLKGIGAHEVRLLPQEFSRQDFLVHIQNLVKELHQLYEIPVI